MLILSIVCCARCSKPADLVTIAVLLILASQRIETAAGGLLWGAGGGGAAAPPSAALSRRGAPPSLVEWLILAWVSGECHPPVTLFTSKPTGEAVFISHCSVAGLIWSEVKQLWDMGLREYVHDMWNVIDFVTNSLYVATVALRVVSHFQVRSSYLLQLWIPV